VIEALTNSTITVVKLDHLGEETWRYQGRLVKQAPHEIILEAIFDHDEIWVEELNLCRGDRFIEYYYDNRWYNIFEVYDRVDGHLKGWYCNVSYPAEITDSCVKYRDLALDLLVYPDGRQVVLDEDEFSRLIIDSKTRAAAWTALNELRRDFNNKMR
jgi:protein associated with RNAse G/E